MHTRWPQRSSEPLRARRSGRASPRPGASWSSASSTSRRAPHGSSTTWRPRMPEVAYVLKGFPRLSELFIASEIHQLEQAGLRLRIYVIKPPDEEVRHPLVDLISAPRRYLPATTSLS